MNRVAYSSIFRGEVRRVLRIWRQTLLPPLISAALFFIVFGNIIGQRVGQTDGVPYTTFIAPGLILMALITASYTNAVAAFFSAKYQKSVEEFLIAPVSNSTIVLGYISGAMFRGLIVGGLVTLLARFFASFSVANPGLVVLLAIFTSSLFALGGLINALFAKKFDDISTFSEFILTPLIYFAGVFYRIEHLPKTFQAISHFNPLYYIISGFRACFLGFGGPNLGIVFGVILGLNLVLFYVNTLLLKRRVGLNV
jgi:ABC-2 type transport system permease protein